MKTGDLIYLFVVIGFMFIIDFWYVHDGQQEILQEIKKPTTQYQDTIRELRKENDNLLELLNGIIEEDSNKILKK